MLCFHVCINQNAFLFFVSLMFTCGVNTLCTFSTTSSFDKLKDAVLFISSEEAPILTLYFPASAIHEEVLVSNEARSSAFNVNVRVSDLPGCNKPVFAKPFNSSDGLSSLTWGALM